MKSLNKRFNMMVDEETHEYIHSQNDASEFVRRCIASMKLAQEASVGADPEVFLRRALEIYSLFKNPGPAHEALVAIKGSHPHMNDREAVNHLGFDWKNMREGGGRLDLIRYQTAVLEKLAEKMGVDLSEIAKPNGGKKP